MSVILLLSIYSGIMTGISIVLLLSILHLEEGFSRIAEQNKDLLGEIDLTIEKAKADQEFHEGCG